jgi:hypothetical protein
MEKNLQVLLSAHDIKRPVLPVSKVELAWFWEALGGPQQHALLE